MRVSQVWKQVATASAKVVFDKKKHFCELGRTRIQLSGDQPLDVYIKASTDIKFGTRTANLLREHVSRFQTLEIRVPMHETAEMLISSIGRGNPAPLLERLEIHIEPEEPEGLPDSSYSFPEFATLPNAFFPCPRLRHLTLPGMPLPDRTTPHFKSLTSLTVNTIPFYCPMDADGVLNILDSTKDLLHFTYLSQDVHNYNYSRIKRRTIPMPNLISADISVPGCGLDILCKLNAPHLTRVRFDGWRNQIFAEDWVDALSEPISESLRLLSKRSPNITHLELRYTEMHKPNKDFEWLWSDSAFPQLEVLRLYAGNISDTTLRFGAGRMRSLKRLELLACEFVTMDGILEFLKGRNQGFELLINACPGVEPEDLAKLKKLVKVL